MNQMIKLPKGVKVYQGNKCWRGAIPSDICPKKYLEEQKSEKKASSKDEKKEAK